MLPYIVVDGARVHSLVTSTIGTPLIGSKGDILTYRGIRYRILYVEWDYDLYEVYLHAEILPANEKAPQPKERALGCTEETLYKVYDALAVAGLSRQAATDTISRMQNSGIYFRENVA